MFFPSIIFFKAGELGSAVGELEKLNGLPADVAVDWLKDAKSRLTADEVRYRLCVSAYRTWGRVCLLPLLLLGWSRLGHAYAKEEVYLLPFSCFISPLQ